MESQHISDIAVSSKTNILKIITDEPALEDDALDFKNYSQRLTEIIINSMPRFSIGIFGDWADLTYTVFK